MTTLEKTLNLTLSRMANLESRIHVLERAIAKEFSVDTACARIVDAVAATLDVSVSDMMTRTRVARISWARQVAMYLCRVLLKRSLHEIGHHFGRDHGTVTHACRHVRQLLDVDAVARDQVARCKVAVTERFSQP